jgi:hypothetical protein
MASYPTSYGELSDRNIPGGIVDHRVSSRHRSTEPVEIFVENLDSERGQSVQLLHSGGFA